MKNQATNNTWTAQVKAIPTDYRGVSFRSRLEAKWASFFDLVGWPWQYEPIDLDGYIPDFVLTFYKPLLVEVKPELYLDGLNKYCDKVQKSGWDQEALIVGTDIFDDGNGWACLGVHAERLKTPDSIEWEWALGIFHKCICCSSWSLHNDTFTFNCRVKGCYEGDHFLNLCDTDEARRIFAVASSVVQYNAQ